MDTIAHFGKLVQTVDLETKDQEHTGIQLFLNFKFFSMFTHFYTCSALYSIALPIHHHDVSNDVINQKLQVPFEKGSAANCIKPLTISILV